MVEGEWLPVRPFGNAIFPLLEISESIRLTIPKTPRKSCFFVPFCRLGPVENHPGIEANFARLPNLGNRGAWPKARRGSNARSALTAASPQPLQAPSPS